LLVILGLQWLFVLRRSHKLLLQAVSAVRSRSCGITVDPPALTQPSFKKLITHYYLSVGLLFRTWHRTNSKNKCIMVFNSCQAFLTNLFWQATVDNFNLPC